MNKKRYIETKKLQRKIFKNKSNFEKCKDSFLLYMKLTVKFYNNECKKILKSIDNASEGEWIK